MLSTWAHSHGTGGVLVHQKILPLEGAHFLWASSSANILSHASLGFFGRVRSSVCFTCLKHLVLSLCHRSLALQSRLPSPAAGWHKAINNCPSLQTALPGSRLCKEYYRQWSEMQTQGSPLGAGAYPCCWYKCIPWKYWGWIWLLVPQLCHEQG